MVGIGVPIMMVGGLFILFLLCVWPITKFECDIETH